MSEMYGVDFNEDPIENEFEIKSRKILGEAVTPSMVTFLKKIGVAKNDSQAMTILMILVLIACGAAYFIARPNTADTLITPDGREISIEEYVTALENGVDLLDS